MHNKRVNYFGILLFIFLIMILIGLSTSKQPAVGFAVKQNKCFEGTAFGECSLVKPKYCDNGALKPICQKCGCNPDEVCQDDGTCLRKCSDGTLFGYCSDSKPFLCSKGTLLENCFKCGCFPGQTCSNDGTCAGNIEVVEGSEEKEGAEEESIEEEKIIEEPEEEKEPVKVEVQEPEIKAEPKVSFWKHLFCRIFYFNDYNACIS